MRIKHHDKRKTVLNLGSDQQKALKELLQIRGDFVSLNDDFDTYADHNKTAKIMKKKNAAFFITSVGNTHINMGRVYDGEFLELIKFKIHKILSSEDFKSIPAEMFVKYFILLQNIDSPRLENMFMDLFNQKSIEANLNGIKYAWIISRIDKIYTLKFVRVLNDCSVEDIGPYFELEIENEFFSTDELYNKAFTIEEPKKTKNVEKNVFKDVIGTLHVDKQDLRDIQLKKNRGYKNKEVNEDLHKKKINRITDQ